MARILLAISLIIVGIFCDPVFAQTHNLSQTEGGYTQSYSRVSQESGNGYVVRTINMQRMGELQELLGEEVNEVDSLVVAGPINYEDLSTMWRASYYGRLTALNLIDALPENNQIPDTTFFRSYYQKKESNPFGYNSINLKTIILPKKLDRIGNKCLFNAKELTNVIFPQSLGEIGEGCFIGTRLKGQMSLPEGLSEIKAGVFEMCFGEFSLELPNSIIKIDRNAFLNTYIRSIDFGSGLEEIGNSAFMSSTIGEIIFPESFTAFEGDSQFRECPFLSKVHFSDNIISLPKSICKGCKSLSDVIFPENLEEINDFAFDGCYNLEAVEIFSNLNRIGDYSFRECSGLKHLILPKSLEYIGRCSFVGCQSLEKIYCAATLPPECEMNDGQTPFGAYDSDPSSLTVSRDIPLYVPKGSGDLYRNSKGWSYFNNIIEIDSDEFPSAHVDYVDVESISEEDNGIYDLSGLKVKSPVPGQLYVRKGKIFVNK